MALLLFTPGCLGHIATGALANALSGTGGSFAKDDDPQLIEDALPFALKTMESVLEDQPEHRGLLAAVSAGFAEYAYGFLRQDADRLEVKDKPGAERVRARMRKLLRRARGYGLRGLKLRTPDVAERLGKDPAALAAMKKEDVPLLYWTAASWGAEISIDKENMELVGDLSKVEALVVRALELDEAWDQGSLHELMMSFELARPGGGDRAVAAAKQHYERALALSQGKHLALFVSWAEGVCVPKQDRKEFNALLDRVLSFDVDQLPEGRLSNVLAQEDARHLKAKADDLFL